MHSVDPGGVQALDACDDVEHGLLVREDAHLPVEPAHLASQVLADHGRLIARLDELEVEVPHVDRGRDPVDPVDDLVYARHPELLSSAWGPRLANRRAGLTRACAPSP